MPLVLSFTPAVVPVTLTEKVQEPLLARVAPDRLIEPDPAVAVIVPPPHEPDSPFGVATTKPVGNVSVKPTPLRAVPVFGLLMVKLNEVEPLSGIVAAPNILLIAGGATTVTLAVA